MILNNGNSLNSFVGTFKTRIISTGDRYGFAIVSNEIPKILYASTLHYFLTPSVKSSYKHPYEARRTSSSFINNCLYHIRALEKRAMEDMTKPIIVDVSAEQMIEDHYAEIYDGIEDKAHSSKGASNEYREKIYNEIKIIVGELKHILQSIKELESKKKIRRILMLYKGLIRKHFGDFFGKEKSQETLLPKMASLINLESVGQSELVSVDLKKEILDDYAGKVCDAISKKHKDIDYFIDYRLGNIIILSSGKPILNIRMNSRLNIDGIFPVGDLYDVYPFYSVEFYQQYWKPIVESIKHFYLTDVSLLLCPERNPLPDIPKNKEKRYTLEGWNMNNNKLGKVNISFRGEGPIWIFEPSEPSGPSEPSELSELPGSTRVASKYVSKYTEQDYINSPIVKCIDSELESIYGRSGTVRQVIPYSDHIEIDVDFGRGLGIVRLTEDKLEIVSVI